ncbi:MAG: DUF1444 family protein [Planctomycetes bacterium]|nr:DUF1444 family protein [Planctomycetota bacterium]
MTDEIEPGLTLEAFAERVAAAARASRPGVEVSFVPGDALALAITGAEGEVHRANLDNLWRSYKLASARGEGFDAQVQAFLRALDPAEEEPGVEQLVVTVRNVGLLEELRALTGDEAPLDARTPVSWPFVADLALVLAFDLPHGIQLAMRADLPRLGLSAEAARERGVKNLLSTLQVERRGDGPVYMLLAGGCYEASLLLARGLWRDLAAAVAGPLVASVPCRDVVYYTGEDEPGGLEALAHLTARMVRTGDHPVSAVLLRFAEDGWSPLGVAEGTD